MTLSTWPRTNRHDERIGWSTSAAITAVVAASWAPQLVAPLPGNHVGNVAARYGLHVRNLYDRGVVGSHFGADWQPYRSTPYAHHPPMLNVLDALVGLVPGESTVQLRLAPFLLALSAVPSATWLLRNLCVGWRATLLSVAAMATTGFYWVYGQVMVDLGPILAVAAATVALGRRGPTDSRVRVAAMTALLACLTSWPGIAFSVVLVAAMAASHRDRATATVAAATAAGIATSLAFMVGAGGASDLGQQVDERTGGSTSIGRLVDVVAHDAGGLLPSWYIVVLPIAVVVGLVDRRTRLLTVLSSVLAGGWVLVLPGGAIVHDYWAYLVLIPGLLGMAAVADEAFDRLARIDPPRSVPIAVTTLVAALLLGSFLAMAGGDDADVYVHRPTQAGRLIESTVIPPDQRFAWSIGFTDLRVLSYYLDRPTRVLTDVELADLADDELIFVDLGRLPGWYPVVTAPVAVRRRDGFAFVRADTLRESLDDDPAQR